MPRGFDQAFHKRIADYIRNHELIAEGDRILVGVSGGPDSVALLRALVELEQDLRIGSMTVAHFDHQLRGEESSQDREFVRKLAEDLGLPFHSKSGDVLSYQSKYRVSIEMAARACRHAFFREALAELKADKIALGHTANDQAEEVLLRLFRGTGPSGIAGMLPKSATGIIRPILFANRAEVIEYLNAGNLPYRQDPSNLAAFCQRNALRLNIFPLLEDFFHDKITETVARHAELVQEEESYWIELIHSCWPKVCVEETTSNITLSAKELGKLHTALRRRMLRFAVEKLVGDNLSFYAVHIEALSTLAEKGASGKMLDLPRGVRASLAEDLLVLSSDPHAPPEPALEAPVEETISKPGLFIFPSFALQISIEDISHLRSASPPTSPNTVWMDADKILWPLLLRCWKPGDRFFPLGLRGSKKLQDFFTDAKIPRAARRKIPILADPEKICWIVGYRLDDRVRVTDATKRVLAINAASV